MREEGENMENTGWNRIIGDAGEDLACRYLAAKGYEILERGFRCRMGEIDIIALKDGEMVFAEVKTRTSRRYGSPGEAVDERKLEHIKRCAGYYLMMTERDYAAARIEVVEIDISHIRCVCQGAGI